MQRLQSSTSEAQTSAVDQKRTWLCKKADVQRRGNRTPKRYDLSVMLKIEEPTDDKAMLADWIAEFLWHWRDSVCKEHKVAEVIMFLLSCHPILFAKSQYRPCPNEEVLFGKLATLLEKGKLFGLNGLSLALNRVWQT